MTYVERRPMPRNGHRPDNLTWLGGADGADADLPTFHIYPLLVVGSLHAIIGPYKEGKSFSALEAAVAIGYKLPFFNRFEIDVPGKVLYIAGEGAEETKHRFEAIKRTRGLPNTQNIAIYGDPFDFKNSQDRSHLMELILRHRFCTVVVDTASRCGAGDESSVDMPIFVEGLTTVQRATRTTLIVIHHTPDYDKGKPRGHTSFPAALDGLWGQRKDKKTGLCTLTEKFSRWSAGDQKIASYKISQYDLGTNKQGRQVNVGLIDTDLMTPRRKAVLVGIQDGKSLRAIADELGVALSVVQGEKAALVISGLVEAGGSRGGRPAKPSSQS